MICLYVVNISLLFYFLLNDMVIWWIILGIFFFRGLDIFIVDLIINYNVFNKFKDYVYRVGRIVRVGKFSKICDVWVKYMFIRWLWYESYFDLDKEIILIY